MIDHLLRFASEADAIAALPQFRAGKGKGAMWDTSRCIPNSRVYSITGTQTITDPETGEKMQVEVRDYLPGWFIQIGLPAEDSALNKLSAATITDRQSKSVTKIDSTVAAKSGWRVEPVFAGA